MQAIVGMLGCVCAVTSGLCKYTVQWTEGGYIAMENCTNTEEVNVNTFLPSFANLKPPSIKTKPTVDA